jgi:hypothetical protein
MEFLHKGKDDTYLRGVPYMDLKNYLLNSSVFQFQVIKNLGLDPDQVSTKGYRKYGMYRDPDYTTLTFSIEKVNINLLACSVSMSLSLSSKENFSPLSSSNSACNKHQSIMLSQRTVNKAQPIRTKQSIKLRKKTINHAHLSQKKTVQLITLGLQKQNNQL